MVQWLGHEPRGAKRQQCATQYVCEAAVTANIYIVAVECIEIIMAYSRILFFEKSHYKKVSEFEKKAQISN